MNLAHICVVKEVIVGGTGHGPRGLSPSMKNYKWKKKLRKNNIYTLFRQILILLIELGRRWLMQK